MLGKKLQINSRMVISKRRLFNWFKVIVILYCLMGIVLYYFQDSILFHPKKLAPDFRYQFSDFFKENIIPLNKKDSIHFLQIYPSKNTLKDQVRGLVILFHEASGNVQEYSKRIKIYTDNGYELWIPDYPGFGKSKGDLNEKSLYEMAFQLNRLAENKYKESDIIIHGIEFGASIAANLASSKGFKHLILEFPFLSIPEMWSTYLPIYPWNSMSRYKMPTAQFLKEVNVPVTIISSEKESSTWKKFLKQNDRIVIEKEEIEIEKMKSKNYVDNLVAVLNNTTTLSK